MGLFTRLTKQRYPKRMRLIRNAILVLKKNQEYHVCLLFHLVYIYLPNKTQHPTWQLSSPQRHITHHKPHKHLGSRNVFVWGFVSWWVPPRYLGFSPRLCTNQCPAGDAVSGYPKYSKILLTVGPLPVVSRGYNSTCRDCNPSYPFTRPFNAVYRGYNSIICNVGAHLVWWCLPTSALQISRGQLLRLSPSPYLDEQ